MLKAGVKCVARFIVDRTLFRESRTDCLTWKRKEERRRGESKEGEEVRELIQGSRSAGLPNESVIEGREQLTADVSQMDQRQLLIH